MKGCVQVYTGDGKGKTTAALGLALRAHGAGLRVFFGQFIKRGGYSEIRALRERLPEVTVEQFGRGRFIRGAPTPADIAAARHGLDRLRAVLTEGRYDVIIADEACTAVRARLFTEDDLLALLEIRPATVEFVLTGRDAGPRLQARADLVTEMRCVKHYYQTGLKSRPGLSRNTTMNTLPAPLTITFENGTATTVVPRTPVRDMLPSAVDAQGLPYIAALVNNDVTSLSYLLEMDCTVRPLTRLDPEGTHVYQRSLTFLLAKAVKALYPAASFSVDHSMGNSIYCSLEPEGGNGHGSGALPEHVDAIRTRMRELVAADIPIERQKISFADAIARFSEAGQIDKLNLLKFRNPPRITIHGCGGFHDLAQGPLAPSTGTLTCFELTHYPPGFVLRLPLPGERDCVAPFKDQPHLFQIFREHKTWGRILGVTTVGRLNETIVNGDIGDFIKISESLHEKKVATIADEITRRREDARIVLIAGPSSAGKTTFSKRLAIQLRVNGLRVSTISLDNYFLGLDQTPRLPDGQPDFEHIESLDLPLFNRHLQQIIAGEEIELPVFDFETKQRSFKGERVRLGPDGLLIIEGIHGLNPLLTSQVPEQNKFRVYVSALTQLSTDFNNRISTTDNRLIRRMVRDRRYRGHSALKTLSMWPAVRRGEERWIFPFQSHADATFNSALDYELAVLKPFAEPLLMEVKPFHREYAEARRLTAFLLNFMGIPDREVPSTSMLREYIGRSGFRY